MMSKSVRLDSSLVSAGLLGLTAVLAGTFGAHGLKGVLSEEMLTTFEIGVRYHLYHAAAVLSLAGFARAGREHRWHTHAGSLMTLGVLLFSGSLYALALTNQRWLGWITPVGGVAFIVGWAMVIMGALGWKQEEFK